MISLGASGGSCFVRGCPASVWALRGRLHVSGGVGHACPT